MQSCDKKNLYFPPTFDAVPAALPPADGLHLASGHQLSYSTVNVLYPDLRVVPL